MFEERADFVAREGPREPLHIVFHEHLDRGAFNRATALDRRMHAAADGHVRAEKKRFCHVERSRDISYCSLSSSNWSRRSSQLGFNRSINATFLVRDHFFSCVSRANASSA